MKKIICSFLVLCTLVTSVLAANLTYTVKKGDSMWKIAVKYEMGVDEIINANPQIKNPNLIYPNQILNIPQNETGVLAYESEVVRLVNEERAKYGLSPLKSGCFIRYNSCVLIPLIAQRGTRSARRTSMASVSSGISSRPSAFFRGAFSSSVIMALIRPVPTAPDSPEITRGSSPSGWYRSFMP